MIHGRAAANTIGQGVAARTIPCTLVLAALTGTLQHALTAAGFTSLFATFVSAAALGAICTVLAYPLKTSPTVRAVPAFCGALLPSLAVAESLLNLVGQSPNAELQLATALLSTLSIGAGLVLSSSVGTPFVNRAAAKFQRRPETTLGRGRHEADAVVCSIGCRHGAEPFVRAVAAVARIPPRSRP